MPAEQPVISEGLSILSCGVEHHFDYAFDVAISRLKSADIHAKASRNRGADLICVKLLPFNFTALEHVGREGLQDGLLTEVESKGFHVASQPTLTMANAGEEIGEAFPVPLEPRPVL